MRPEQRDAIERFGKRTGWALLISIILFDLIPYVALEVTSLVMAPNTPRGEVPDGFPPVDPQLWMTWIPVAVLGLWIAVTVPVPYRRTTGMGRVFMLISVVIVFFATVMRVASVVWIPGVASGGTRYIFVVILVLGALHLVRMVLGGLRLVPRSWRQYLDEQGNPETQQRTRSGERGDSA